MATDNLLNEWGKNSPDQQFLPNGDPNPYYDSNPKRHGPGRPQQSPTMPDWSKRQSSTGELPGPDTDLSPKRHGSLPVAIPPRTVHNV
jgi:hypothetical protein